MKLSLLTNCNQTLLVIQLGCFQESWPLHQVPGMSACVVQLDEWLILQEVKQLLLKPSKLDAERGGVCSCKVMLHKY